MFQALSYLHEHMHIGKLYHVQWSGRLPVRAYYAYKKLAKQVTTKPLGAQAVSFVLSTTSACTIAPLGKKLTYQKARYPALYVRGCVDNEPFAVYATKPKKLKHKG